MRTLVLLLILSISQPSLAQEEAAGEPSLLKAVLETYRDLPQNKAELIEQVEQDFAAASAPYLNDLVRATPYQDIDALVTALEKTEDPAILARLAERLQDSSGTYLRFLARVQKRIQADPAKLEHMTKLTELLIEHMREKPLPKLSYARRSTDALLTIGATVALLYAYWVDYSKDNAIVQEHFLHKMSFVPPAFAIYLSLCAFNDFRAFKLSRGIVHDRAATRAEGLRSLETIHDLLVEIKSTPETAATLALIRYYGSKKGEQDMRGSIPELTRQFVAQMEKLKDEGQTGQLQAFTKSQAFFGLVKELDQSFSASEKAQINAALKADDLELPFTISPKVLLFESKVASAFNTWLGNGGNPIDLRAAVIRREEDLTNRYVEHTHPSHGTELNVLGLTVAVTIAGVQAGIGLEPTAMDQVFGVDIVEFLRQHSQQSFQLVNAAILGPLAFHLLEFKNKLAVARSQRWRGVLGFKTKRLLNMLNHLRPSGKIPGATSPPGLADKMLHELERDPALEDGCEELLL